MRESPLVSLIRMPWWINLLIGLGMLAFGELLKIADPAGASPGKVALGQSVQFFSIVFLSFSIVSFLVSCYKDFFSKTVRQPETAPVPARIEPLRPAPPPPPKKRKYTDRDFMPAALRAELDARGAGAAPDKPLNPLPPPPPDKTSGTPELKGGPGNVKAGMEGDREKTLQEP